MISVVKCRRFWQRIARIVRLQTIEKLTSCSLERGSTVKIFLYLAFCDISSLLLYIDVFYYQSRPRLKLRSVHYFTYSVI